MGQAAPGALGLGLGLVGLLEQLPQVLGHEVGLFRRAVVALQVFHCKERPPAPRRGAGVGLVCWRLLGSSGNDSQVQQSLWAHPGPPGVSLSLSLTQQIWEWPAEVEKKEEIWGF